MPDQSLPMPGGALPSSDILVPYSGGQVRISPEAQQAQKAASEFQKSFPDVVHQAGRKHNRLDVTTQRNLDELTIYMRQNRPKPAMVINLHPFELQFNADNYLLRGHTVPACEPGMPYNYRVIRGWRHDGGSYSEDGSRNFKPIVPIDVAGQFMREFNKRDNFGPGVIIYSGETHPDKVGQVETYDLMGRPITEAGQSVDYDEEDRPFPVDVQNNVMRAFVEIMKEVRIYRNEFYLGRVREAESWAKKGEKFTPLIQKSHHLMAQVLVAEMVIPTVPPEITGLATREQRGIAEQNCPSCQRPVSKGAYKCEHCANILDALAAFKDGAIEFEHGKIAMLPDEQLPKPKPSRKSAISGWPSALKSPRRTRRRKTNKTKC
jgi:hypothetical protein